MRSIICVSVAIYNYFRSLANVITCYRDLLLESFGFEKSLWWITFLLNIQTIEQNQLYKTEIRSTFGEGSQDSKVAWSSSSLNDQQGLNGAMAHHSILRAALKVLKEKKNVFLKSTYRNRVLWSILNWDLIWTLLMYTVIVTGLTILSYFNWEEAI